MIIRFGDLKSEQTTLQGEVGIDIFQIEANGDIRSIGPITCDLDTSICEDLLIVDGKLSVPSVLRCVGCLEDFPSLWDVSDYHAEIEIENDRLVDLTEHIRDDILLKIPNYPHCDDGEQPGRICPMTGPFSYESKGTSPPADGSAPSQPPDVWDALENLDTGDH